MELVSKGCSKAEPITQLNHKRMVVAMSQTLSQFASPLAAKNHFVKISIGGFSGSGKSRTGSELVAGVYKDLKCTKPLLIIDNEKGLRFLEPFFKRQGIPTLVKDTTRLPDVIQAFEFLRLGEIDFLFMDSLSKVWYQYVRDYKEKNRVTFMKLQNWGEILPAWQEEFSDRFVDCPGNIVFTGRGGFTYTMEDKEDEKTGETKRSFVQSGVKMKLAGETPFEPDLNIWMSLRQEIVKGRAKIWREAQIIKDRSGVIDGKTFQNPSYKDFQPVVKFVMEVPKGEVAGASNTANVAPAEDFDWHRRKREREIEVEKIKALFDAAAMGTSKEDKQLKTIIFQRVVGTTSSTEFERMEADRLAIVRSNLERLFAKWNQMAPHEHLPYVNNFKVMSEIPIEDPFSDVFGPKDATASAESTAPEVELSKKYVKLLGEIKKAKDDKALLRVIKKIDALAGSGELLTTDHVNLQLEASKRSAELRAA